MVTKTPQVTRTRSVLTLDEEVASGAEFAVFNSVDNRPRVNLPMAQWDELGNPDSITITIWPGDRQDLMEGDPEQAQAQIRRQGGDDG